MDQLFHKAIDELSIHRDVDLHSFDFPYAKDQITQRIADLGLGDVLSYVDYIESNPSEADTIYWNYIYDLRIASDHIVDFSTVREYIDRYLEGKSTRDFKIWMPMCSDKLLVTYFNCILEDKKRQDLIDNYHIYLTHPNRDKLASMRSAKWNLMKYQDVPESYTRDYFNLDEHGELEVKPGIRLHCIYANHDPLIDNPIKSLDMIVTNHHLNIFSGFRKRYILRQYFESLKTDGFILNLTPNVINEYNQLFQILGDESSGVGFSQKRNDLVPANRRLMYTPFRYVPKNQLGFENDIHRALFDAEDIAFMLISEDYNLTEISDNLKSVISLKEGFISAKITEVLDVGLCNSILNLLEDHKKLKKPIQKSLDSDNIKIKGRFNQITSLSLPLRNSNHSIYVVYLWKSHPETEEDNQEKYERAIREIHHRVKNQMTIIFSLMDLESVETRSQDVFALLNRMASRIHAIEIIQNRLSEDPFKLELELNTIIQDYILHINSLLFKNDLSIPIQFSSDALGIIIPSKIASPILLILSEITSHMVEDISLDEKKVRMEIFCMVENKNASITLSMESLEENSRTEWKDPSGLAVSIIEANTRQINAKLQTNKSDTFIRYNLIVPLI